MCEHGTKMCRTECRRRPVSFSFCHDFIGCTKWLWWCALHVDPKIQRNHFLIDLRAHEHHKHDAMRYGIVDRFHPKRTHHAHTHTGREREGNAGRARNWWTVVYTVQPISSLKINKKSKLIINLLHVLFIVYDSYTKPRSKRSQGTTEWNGNIGTSR